MKEHNSCDLWAPRAPRTRSVGEKIWKCQHWNWKIVYWAIKFSTWTKCVLLQNLLYSFRFKGKLSECKRIECALIAFVIASLFFRGNVENLYAIV